MKYLPSEYIIYKSKLNIDEVKERLLIFVRPATGINSKINNHSKKIYEGRIVGNAFELQRLINYHTSFLPIVRGEIEDSIEGSTIKVKMNLLFITRLGLLFMIAFMMALCFFLMIIQRGKFNFSAEALIPSIMLLPMYLLTMLFFKYESLKTKKDLKIILDAEIIEE